VVAVHLAIAAALITAAPQGRDSDVGELARVLAVESDRVRVIEAVTPAAVCVFSKERHAGGGSGVIIDPRGYGLTNFHVIAGMLKDRVGDAGLADGTLNEFEVLGIDPGGDVAMFKLRGEKVWPAASLGDSETLRQGDYVLALGNPFGLADDFTPAVTLGIVSGLHRYQAGVKGALTYTDCIQVDASINPGNSGGPLFDLAGRVIGINGRIAIEERERVNVGVGFSISINQIKRFIPALRAGIATPHASAGFTVADRDRRVIIDNVKDGSIAEQAGIRAGDELLRFAGRDVSSANQFLSALGAFPGGWTVEVVHRRGRHVEKKTMRLDPQALPDFSGGARGGKKARFNPYAPHSITRAANRRAVRRAFDRYHAFLGGEETVAAIESIHGTGKRTLATDPTGEPASVLCNLDVAAEPSPAKAQSPADTELAIRRMLLSTTDDPARSGFKVVGADEVQGRIAVLLEQNTKDGPPLRLAFDDEDGALLRISFDFHAVGKDVSFEYGDERRAGPLRLPHIRRMYVDGVLYAEDSFERIVVTQKAP